MSVFESNGVFEETGGGIYDSPSISGTMGGHRTVEDDVLAMQAGAPAPLFPRATPGIPYTLGSLGGVKGNIDDWKRYQTLAVVEAAKFKMRYDQALRVTCPVLKLKLAKAFGVPSDENSAMYRYNAVMGDIGDSRNKDLYGSSGYMEYAESRRQNRVNKLVKWNAELGPMVEQAIQQCGLSSDQGGGTTQWTVTAEQALADAQAAYAVANNLKQEVQMRNFWYKAKVAVDAATVQKKPAILKQAQALLKAAEAMLASIGKPPPKPEPTKPDEKDKLPMGLILGGGAAFVAVLALLMTTRR